MKEGRAVLLVHDVVNHFLRENDAPLLAALSNIRPLVDASRRAGLPVVFAAPGRGDPAIGPPPAEQGVIWDTQDVDVPSSLGPRPGDTVVRKPRWGAFYGTVLEQHLREMGRDTIILCGISLAGGVETTVRDAYNRDLNSIVVADACRCRALPDCGWGAFTSEMVANVTLSVLTRFARIATTDEICRELHQWI